MTTETALYPPGPAHVPAEITRLDSAYRLRVVAMIAGLFLFVFVYVAIVVAAGLLAFSNYDLYLRGSVAPADRSFTEPASIVLCGLAAAAAIGQPWPAGVA